MYLKIESATDKDIKFGSSSGSRKDFNSSKILENSLKIGRTVTIRVPDKSKI